MLKAITHFVSSHIWTILEAVAKIGSVLWWSIELYMSISDAYYPLNQRTYLKANFAGKIFNGCLPYLCVQTVYSYL